MYELIKRAVIEVESNCNFNCSFCIQRNKDNSRMSFEDYKNIVDELESLGLETIQLEGSGESTLREDLPKFIAYGADKGIKMNIYTNGYLMRNDFMRECVDSGLSLCRFSINGYDEETYWQATGLNVFKIIMANAIMMREYAPKIIKTYHIAFELPEVQKYIENVVNVVKADAEIWKMHNWAGRLKTVREGPIKTCGRPFAPEITIRSNLDVYPCCQTLDERAVLGNVKEGVLKAYNSDKYRFHRVRHRAEQFPEYCKECDFLRNDESVLLWSNCQQKIGKMNNVKVDLNDFSD